uniref:Uncharacterized protein n=1 Tax=viral metagenome TaxID=1070528 RepID=A0A6C0E5K4_9ZZZZ
MSYKATTVVNVVFFPNTVSINYDVYPIPLVSSGIGDTPSVAYKNSIYNGSLQYEADLAAYIVSKNYPDLQVESTLQSIIIRQSPKPFTPPIPPSNIFAFYNSPKNTVVVRNQDNSTSQNTSTAFYPSNCLFNAYYRAFDVANLDINVNANSICATSYLTHTTN